MAIQKIKLALTPPQEAWIIAGIGWRKALGLEYMDWMMREVFRFQEEANGNRNHRP